MRNAPTSPRDLIVPGTEPPASRGLGDTIAKVTKKLGVKPCQGCKKRQKKLNEMVPYKRGSNEEAG